MVKTDKKHYLVSYGAYYIALKKFRILNKKLVGCYQYNNYQYQKIFNIESEAKEKVIRIDIEPNNQIQGVEFEFYCLNSFNVISRYTKQNQAMLGYHAVFFTDFLKNHLLKHYTDNFSLVFDMMPVVFGYDDIQAISDDSVVIEKFSIKLNYYFYGALAKKLGVDDSVTINQWIETLNFFKENLGL